MCKICDFKFDDITYDRISDEVDITYTGEIYPALTDGNIDWWIEVEFIFDKETKEFNRTCAWLWAKPDLEWDETVYVEVESMGSKPDRIEHKVPLFLDETWLISSISYCPECGRDLSKLTIQDVEDNIKMIEEMLCDECRRLEHVR